MPFFCMPSNKKPAVKPTTQTAPKPLVVQAKTPITDDTVQVSGKTNEQPVEAVMPSPVKSEQTESTHQPATDSPIEDPDISEPQLHIEDDIEDDVQSQEQEQTPLLQHVIDSVMELDCLTGNITKHDAEAAINVSDSTFKGDHELHSGESEIDESNDALDSKEDKTKSDEKEKIHEGEDSDEQDDVSTVEEKPLTAAPVKTQSKLFQCCASPSIKEELENTAYFEEVAA